MNTLFYYDENMTLAKLINMRDEALRLCPNKRAKKKYIQKLYFGDRYFYGHKRQLEYICKEYGYDIKNWYAII